MHAGEAGVAVVEAEVTLRERDPRIRLGFTGRVRILLDPVAAPLVVPARAVFVTSAGPAVRVRGESEPRAVKTDRDGVESYANAGNRSLVLFDEGNEVVVNAGPEGVRFLLVSGRPLGEPVAWAGPIVMNTQEELRRAYDELRRGTFIKER